MSATANRTGLYLVKEVTYGTTPATPAFEPLRITSEDVNYSATNAKSKELRSDRNSGGTVRTDASVTGGFDAELSSLSFDTAIAAFLASTFSAPVANLSTIKNGIVNSSFSIQKRIQDATSPFFQTFTGCRFTTWELDIKPGDFIKSKFGIMGRGQSNATTQIAGATTSAAATTQSMTGTVGVNTITINGSASTEIISSMTLKMDNNARVINQIGLLGAADILLGTFDVTGTMDMYFQDATAYNRLVNDTPFSLSFKLQDAAGAYYKFTLPVVKFESGTLVAGGLDTDMVYSGTFRATYDSVSLATLTIERLTVP